MRGIQRRARTVVSVTGGLAGDGPSFVQTWVLRRRPPRQHRTTIGLYGKTCGVTPAPGADWDKFGPERIVTRSEDSVLFELDGKAGARPDNYLGDRAAGLAATGLLFPLALRDANDGRRRRAHAARGGQKRAGR